MEIKEIEIENYKGISTIKFNPKKINIIVGKNNTSKTSIIQAINLLFHNSEIETGNMDSYFNIYSNSKNIKISAKLNEKKESIEIREPDNIEVIRTFVKELMTNFLENLTKKTEKTLSEKTKRDLEKIIEKLIDKDFERFLFKNALVITNQDNKSKVYYGFNYRDIETIENFGRKLEKYILENIFKEKKREYEFSVKVALDMAIYAIARGSEDLKKSGNKNIEVIYIESLKELIEEEFSQKLTPKDAERLDKVEQTIKKHDLIKNLYKLDFNNILFILDDGTKKSHSFNFLGDGFKSILGLLWELSREENRNENLIVLLDEPETHMHPGYILELIELIIDFSKKFNTQFFITTHNQDVLEILLSNRLDEKSIDYIKKELAIIKTEKLKGSKITMDFSDYEKAILIKDKLLLDLRGI